MLHVCDKLGNLYTNDYDLFVFVLFDLHDGNSSHTVAQSTRTCYLAILVQRRNAIGPLPGLERYKVTQWRET